MIHLCAFTNISVVPQAGINSCVPLIFVVSSCQICYKTAATFRITSSRFTKERSCIIFCML